MTFLKSFVAFWYDFIIGDDWKIAVAVVTSLGLLCAVMKADILNDAALTILGAVIIVTAFSISLILDVRPKSTR
jgi:hypothetical protein